MIVTCSKVANTCSIFYQPSDMILLLTTLYCSIEKPVNQGLATLAFFGVGVNLVLFLTRVLQQNNATAANSVSKWTGTVYIFSLVGAFLSDSYWGRYKTCAIFQIIFVIVSTMS